MEEAPSQLRLHRAPLDRLPRLKTRLGLRFRDPILKVIDKLPVNSRVSRAYRQTLRRLVGPVLWSIKLEVNNDCNLACKMCYAPKGKDVLLIENIKRLLDDIANIGTRLEILGGEPLLREDLEEIIHYAKEKAHLPQVILYTNATLVDRERAAALKRAGLDAALVTFMSCDEEEVHAMGGSWNRTIEGMRHLKAAGIEVYTFTAVHAANIHRVKEIAQFAREALDAHALFYQYIPQKKKDPLIPDKNEWATTKHWVLYEKCPAHARFVRNFCTLFGSACSGGNFVFTVKVDGTVTPCPFIFDIVLGNIKEQSLWEIVQNRYRVRAFREFLSLPNECRDCNYADVCNGGCKAGNGLLFGRYDRKDVRCLGPWREPVQDTNVSDRLPCFF
jgi:pyrroloquinoline quinone biosynthesis protein E